MNVETENATRCRSLDSREVKRKRKLRELSAAIVKAVELSEVKAAAAETKPKD